MNLSALLPSKGSNLQQTSQLFARFIQLESVKYSSEDNLFCDFSLLAYLLDLLYHPEFHLAVLLKIYGVLYTPCPLFRLCPKK